MAGDDGFAVHDAVVPAAACEALLDALARHVDGRRAGARHLLREPHVAALAASPPLVPLARQALDAFAGGAPPGGTTPVGGASGPIPLRATLFAKSGRANWLVAWHQDTALPFAAAVELPGFGPWSVKDGVRYAHAPTWLLRRIVALRVHLDASTADNGPLRVVPGSHRLGVLDDPQVAAFARAHAAATCLVPRGGVLAMSPLLIHASSKARTDAPRRVLHLEYADALQPAPGVRLQPC